MFGTDLWGIVVIVGPILLALAIVWAMLRNKVSPRQEAQTERATKRMYEEQSREDDARE